METEHAQLTFQAPDPSELTGLLPGYEVQSLIAVGGMGAVYRAVQISLDRAVAIKILPRELGGDALFRAQFETEAKAMALLNHANLAGVYDFGNAEGLLYIVMEFVEGESLYHHAYGKYLEQEEAIRYTKAICLGLHHAHENGVLHRDIKPSNILLDLHGQPKVVDFGLAQGIRQVHGKDEEIFGTPHYTAPEVLSAPGAIDARADLFSVGVILHELLTGRVPASDPRSASAIVQCDPRLDGVIRKATHPNPAFRYNSCGDMAAELDAISQTPAPRSLRTFDQRVTARVTARVSLASIPRHTTAVHLPSPATVAMAATVTPVAAPVLNVASPPLLTGNAGRLTRPTAGLAMARTTSSVRPRPVLASSSGPNIGVVLLIVVLVVGALLCFMLVS